MQIYCCTKCGYKDINEAGLYMICPRCSGGMVSLGVGTGEWNIMSVDEQEALSATVVRTQVSKEPETIINIPSMAGMSTMGYPEIGDTQNAQDNQSVQEPMYSQDGLYDREADEQNSEEAEIIFYDVDPVDARSQWMQDEAAASVSSTPDSDASEMAIPIVKTQEMPIRKEKSLGNVVGMEPDMKPSKLNIVAGILHVIVMLYVVFNTVTNIVGWGIDIYAVLNIVSVVIVGVIAVCLLMGSRMPIFIGYAALAAVKAAMCVLSILDYGMDMEVVVTDIIPIAVLVLIAVFISLINSGEKSGNDSVKKLWMIPGIVMVIDAVASVFVFLVLGYYISISSIIIGVIKAIAYLTMMNWIAYPFVQSQSVTGSDEYNGEGYIKMHKHILLLIYTGGIWLYVWIYRTTKYLNSVDTRSYEKPLAKLLLCMFVPFYIIYFYYKTAKRIDMIKAQKFGDRQKAGFCLILALLANILVPVILQDDINIIAKG